MSAPLALEVEDLGKCYRIYNRPADRLRQAILGRFGYCFYDEKWALRGVNFVLARGTALGVIGRNGAGKSTLLQIIAGTLAPTTGRALTNGRVVALLELGSGFNPEFTGRENVYLYGALFGLTRNDVDGRFDAIAAFADIGTYLDRSLKTYSTGMAVRLAFAVIAHLDPDILIVDEALAVGDVFFQHKCMRHIGRLLDDGTSLLFASHAPDFIKRFCQKSIWIADGVMAAFGDSGRVVEEYLADARMEAASLPSSSDLDVEMTFEVVDPPSPEQLPLHGGDLPLESLVCRGDAPVEEFFIGERGHSALVVSGRETLIGFRTTAPALELIFGGHPYAGLAGILVDGLPQVVNLYAPVARKLRVPLPLLDQPGREHVILIGSAGTAFHGKGDQVWFLEAVQLAVDEAGAPVAFKRSVAFQQRAVDGRYGAGGATISFVEVLDANSLTPIDVAPFGATVTVRIHAELTTPCHQFDAGFLIRDREGRDLFGTTAHEQGVTIPGSPGLRFVDFTFQVRLRHGSYSVHAALAARGPELEQLVPLDVIQIATIFQVTADPIRPVWYIFDEPVIVRSTMLAAAPP